MPCGGIYPMRDSWVEKLITYGDCFYCDCETHSDDLWVEEWDAPLHRNCLDDFKKTDEYQIIIKHGHDITL